MKEIILKRLEEQHHCTTSNGRVAVWLSDGADKINLEGLEEPFCTTDVLLFKQAIAQGWDCPRAAILLIYRELRQETFALQTVGRILRMPEQRHYAPVQREELDYGYVYTDLSREFITIVPEDEDYITQNQAKRRAAYTDVELTLSANHIITSIDRNRLGAKYRKALYRVAEEYFDISMDFSVFDAANAAKKAGTTDAVIDHAESQQIRNVKALQAKMIRTDVKNIEVAVAVNIAFDVQQSYDEGKRIEVDALHKARFARTRSELEQSFRRFCAQHCGNYAKADSTEVMSFALKKLLFEYCGFGDLDAMKIILETNNSLHFTEVLAQSLTEYARLQEEEAKKRKQTVTSSSWSVPKERSYNDKIYAHQENIAYHILEPFYERNDVSRPEKEFARFLEANVNDSPHGVRWWYKNGDSGREHFAIEYAQTNGTKSLFFPDFIVQLNNEVLCVFDTKTPDSDPAAPQKHNALLAWAAKRTTHSSKTIGSLVVPHLVGETITWKYCSASITDTNNLSTWQTLILSNVHERI